MPPSFDLAQREGRRTQGATLIDHGRAIHIARDLGTADIVFTTRYDDGASYWSKLLPENSSRSEACW